jgi:transmembrane sensor
MNTQIYEEASDWLVKNREGDLDPPEKKRFDAWLRESPQHLRAYLEMSAVWEDVASIDPSLNASADELIARAHEEANIYPLALPRSPLPPGEGQGEGPPRATARRRFTLAGIALAASVVVAVGIGTRLYLQREVYTTGIGEQRSVVLNDGSTIELNSRSRVRVRFSEAERDVDLIEGQALFRVAKNPARPFIVSADGTHVRAVGTQFDVYRKTGGTVVTVVEGRVAVYSPPAPGQGQGEGASLPSQSSVRHIESEVLLAAGEQLTVAAVAAAKAGAQPSPRRANVAAATAWTQRSLVFDSAPLTEVAEEFNRYNTRQLVIEDTRDVADIHISGMFSSADPALLLRFLRTQPELVVEETDGEIRISKK